MEAAIDSFLPHKGPGPDMLPPCVYQHFGTRAVNRLKNIIKGSYLLHYVPKSWLGVRVIFIPKPDKETYADPRSFRPISLMNFVLKIMEKILLWQNEEKVLSQKPLHKNQHGFRKARSTDSA